MSLIKYTPALDANSVEKPTDGNVNLYIATTGSDATGDGTSGNPWATIQRGLDEASGLRANGRIIINIANGTYQEDLVIPEGALGNIRLLGNAVTPNNVVLQSTNAATAYCIYHDNPAVILDIKGVQLSSAFVGLYVVRNATANWYYANTNDVNYAIIGGETSTITIQSDVDGDSAWVGDATNDSIAVSVSGGATFVNYQNLTITEFSSGLFASFNSFIGTYGSGTLTVDNSGAASPFVGMSLRHRSMLFTSQDFDFDNGTAATNRFGLEVSTGYVSFVFGQSTTLRNSQYGLYMVLDSVLLGSGASFTYDTCTTDVFAEYDFSGSGDDTWDTTDVVYSNLLGNARQFGYDNRYMPHQQVSTGTASTTDATVTVMETIDMSTADTTYMIRTEASAIRDSGAEGAVYELKAGFRNDGGVLAQIGATSAFFQEDDATWAMDYNINGTDVEVRCTGAGGKNVEWKSTTTTTQSTA